MEKTAFGMEKTAFGMEKTVESNIQYFYWYEKMLTFIPNMIIYFH